MTAEHSASQATQLFKLLAPALLVISLAARPSTADTVWLIGKGREEAIARDVIVINESGSPEYGLTVSYWHLTKNGTVAVENYTAEPQQRLRVTRSSQEERRALLRAWRRRGVTCVVTNEDGTTAAVMNCGFTFDPPPGKRLLIGNLPMNAAITLDTQQGRREIQLSTVSSILLRADSVTVLRSKGMRVVGSLALLYQTDGTALSQTLFGWKEEGSEPLNRVFLSLDRVLSIAVTPGR